eukprot:gnl/TRDRNA2_/TRDRNA2_67602_c1_seq1.p1 gnl/TRDRNA2_/TRDRNA2_67602_c1~~gnl/TRDRNA2_/TRDRNA2_67602_c1_seq1.p1  ORF type:complete len:290 (+),score=39.72 gnl/TRDRNA2_/TRDRNA2_67602_c1_seq1:2-871(+)
MRFFRELRLMLYSLLSSALSLCWCFIVIGFILYLCGLICLQGVTGFMIYEPPDAILMETSDAHQLLDTAFGSLYNTMVSLYSGVTGGTDWMELYEALAVIGDAYAYFFLFYTAFFIFAVFNVLTAIFVENAVILSQPDRHDLLMKQRRKEKQVSDHLKTLIQELDDNGDGTIHWEEFQHTLSSDQVAPTLRAMGLDIRDAELFYNMLRASITDGTEGVEMTVDAFVDGCMKMRGQATSIDLMSLVFQVQKIQETQKKFIDSFESRVISAVRGGPKLATGASKQFSREVS